MALKHAVLGLLVQRRSYGYDLVRELTAKLGPAWQLSPSTVYAALDQLERESLIRSCAERRHDSEPAPPRGSARRIVFEATDEGREVLIAHLSRPEWQPEPVRGELCLRVAVARPCHLPGLLGAVDLAEHLTLEIQKECSAQLPPDGEGSWTRTTSDLVRSAAAIRLDGELRWLRLVREDLRAAAEGDSAPGGLNRRAAPTPAALEA